MKNLLRLLVLLTPIVGFGQNKEIVFSELTPGSGMFLGAVMSPTTITVTVQGPSDRYLAFGFGTGMANGNDAIIWSTLGTGAAPLSVRDHNMIGQGAEPAVDAQQDWSVVSNTVSGGNRTIVLTRALSTGDANDFTFNFSATTQNLFWAKAASPSNQLLNHGGGNRASGIVRNWVVQDVTPPTLNTITPADNANGVSLTTNFTMVFSENVSWGAGSFRIYDGANNLIQTVSNGNPNVSITGATVFYNPPTNLVMNTNYYVQIDATAFKDASNNFYTGINDNTTWNFNTNDIAPPALVASPFVPADNANGVALSSPMTITFNETVQAGTGSIELYTGAGVLVESYDVTSSPLISFSGAVVTINPTDFVINSSYYAIIPAGAIKDISNNNYAGFSANTTWNWNTNDLIPPTVVGAFVPADNATNVATNSSMSITFNEPIQLGTGVITLFTGTAVTVETFNPAAITLSAGNTVATFTPSAALIETQPYYLNIPSGFFQDLNANAYAGFTNNTTWNFVVGDFTAPTAVTFTPNDNATNVPLNNQIEVAFDEAVTLGTGSLYLKNETTGSQIEFSSTLGNITVGTSTMTLDLPANLVANSNYHITMDANFVKDASNNAFAGLSDTTAWSFSTISTVGLNELAKTDYLWNNEQLVIYQQFENGEILDMSGRVVRTLTAQVTNLNDLPTGVYTIRLKIRNSLASLRIYVE